MIMITNNVEAVLGKLNLSKKVNHIYDTGEVKEESKN